jgi:hypothetical protein
MVVHLASTNDIGLRAAVEAPARRPDGTWNIKLTVAVFRPWRGSQATIASDPAFDAAPRFARPRRRLDEEFSPAVAGCRQQGTANSPPSTTKFHKKLEPMAPRNDARSDLLRTCLRKFGVALPTKLNNFSNKTQ